jgi:hypothetical protein
MFGFLNSTVLFAAVAALIPLIIHLFSKRRVKVVEFSSLRHLKAMQRRQVRRLKIRQWLLLLLRMLIILTVVLAFARPTTQRGSIGSHASVSAVILFDNSASMNRFVADGNLFDLAKRRTATLLETFGQADQVCLEPLYRSSAARGSISFTSAAVAKEELRRLGAGWGQADFEGTLDHARSLLAEATNLNREIYIVTDRQRHGLPNNAAAIDSTVRVILVDLPLEANENVGITSVDFGGQLITPGHDFELSATVKNYGSEDRSNLIASLSLDDNRVAQTAVTVAAQGETVVHFERAVSHTGFHSGFVEISDDKFLGDNRYNFSFRIPERLNLLVVDGDGAGAFIALALTPSATANQYWSAKQTSPGELAGVNFLDYDAVVLSGAPVLPDNYVSRLKAFIAQGKAAFFTYDVKTDIDYFNGVWSSVTGVAFDEPARRDFTRAGYFAVETIDVEHPVFSVFGFEKNKPPEIRFYTLPKLHLTGEVRTLLEFSGNRPGLVESKYGQGRVLTFTGPVLPDYCDLTGHAFFVPFVSRVVEYLASDLSSYDLHLFVGESVTRSISLKGAVRASLEMTTPDSNLYSLPPEEMGNTLALRAKPVDVPGIYRVSSLGAETDRFAVNVKPEECNLDAVDVDQFATAIGARTFRQLDRSSDPAVALAEMRFGKELWQLFLWAAVVLMLMEILLSRSTRTEE